MALSYKARRRWSLVILLIGLPLYVVAAVTIMNALDRQGLMDTFGGWAILAELCVYIALGVIWALPFRFVFRGIGKADPDHPLE
jgi:hypothetical protein